MFCFDHVVHLINLDFDYLNCYWEWEKCYTDNVGFTIIALIHVALSYWSWKHLKAAFSSWNMVANQYVSIKIMTSNVRPRRFFIILLPANKNDQQVPDLS